MSENMPDKPSEREIWFAQVRSRLANAINDLYLKPIEVSGFVLRDGGAEVDTPSGHLDGQTLKGQGMKFYFVFGDKSGQDYRVDFMISHNNQWDAVLDILPSVGEAKPTMILKTDEAVASGIEDMKRFYLNFVERIKNREA
jgi:hypothetical protein